MDESFTPLSRWKSMRSPRQFSVLLALAFFGVFVAYFTALNWLDGPPGGFVDEYDAARFFTDVMGRTSVTLISSVFASLFLAIPLTSTMYTPQLIELFVRSWTNRLVLGLFVFSAAHAALISRMVTRSWIPKAGIFFTGGLVVVSLSVLLPYLLFVFRFLDPDTIIERVARSVIQAMQPGKRWGVREQQAELSRRIHQLGNIILRCLDRADREVALAAVEALERCAEAYMAVEESHPPEWFVVDTNHFPGLSRAAIELLNRDHVWVEMEILRQLARAYEAALTKVPDVLSAISRMDRHFALAASQRDDVPALRLSIRFFNNFLHEAIRRRDVRAVFDVLYQYRYLAIELWPARPEMVLEIARDVDHYGRMASLAGMGFAQDLVAYDLGAVLARAALAPRPELPKLLDFFLRLRRPGGTDGAAAPSLCMVKARLILAVQLLEQDQSELGEAVKRSLADVPAALLSAAREDLLGNATEYFREVTDRQLHLDHLTDAQKAQVEVMLDALGAGGRGGSGPLQSV
jgi:predicted membrane protein DUF2254